MIYDLFDTFNVTVINCPDEVVLNAKDVGVARLCLLIISNPNNVVCIRCDDKQHAPRVLNGDRDDEFWTIWVYQKGHWNLYASTIDTDEEAIATFLSGLDRQTYNTCEEVRICPPSTTMPRQIA